MKWKVLVEGDSYGLPRFDKGSGEVALSYEETYPEQLRRGLLETGSEDVVLVNRCRHANTTYSLISGEANELCFLRPDVTIIQMGLTDLWPAKYRKILPLQAELTGKDPWVELADYRENLRRFASCALELGSRVVIVGIPRISRAISFRFPAVSSRIATYDQAAASVAAVNKLHFLDWRAQMADHADSEMIGEDGIHPTPEASALLAKALRELLMAGPPRDRGDFSKSQLR